MSKLWVQLTVYNVKQSQHTQHDMNTTFIQRLPPSCPPLPLRSWVVASILVEVFGLGTIHTHLYVQQRPNICPSLFSAALRLPGSPAKRSC